MDYTEFDTGRSDTARQISTKASVPVQAAKAGAGFQPFVAIAVRILELASRAGPRHPCVKGLVPAAAHDPGSSRMGP